MRTLGGYFYVYVFAIFIVGFAAAVAMQPRAFVEKIRPAVIGTVETLEETEVYLRALDRKTALSDTVTLYAAAISLPSTVLEHVSEALQRASERTDQG